MKRTLGAGVPEAFEVGGLDSDPDVKAALAMVGGSQPFEQAREHARALAWPVFLVGGGPSTAAGWVATKTAALLELDERIRRLRARAQPVEAQEAHRAGLAASLEAARQVRDAAAAWGGTDNVALQRKVSACRAEAERLRAQAKRYDGTSFPVPVELPRAVFAAERALHEAEAAFEAGAEQLRKMSPEAQAAVNAARELLSKNVAGRLKRIAARAKDSIPEGEVSFLIDSPEHAPDALVQAYREAQRVAALADRLGKPGSDALADFFEGIGSAVRAILQGALSGRVVSIRQRWAASERQATVERAIRSKDKPAPGPAAA